MGRLSAVVGGQYCTLARSHRSQLLSTGTHLLRHTPCAPVSQMRSRFLDFFARLSHFFLSLTATAWSWDRPEQLAVAVIGKRVVS